MISPARILRSIFIDMGLVYLPLPTSTQTPSDPTIPCFADSYIDKFDRSVFIRDTQGQLFGWVVDESGAGIPLVHPEVLILVRHTDTVLGRTLAIALANAMDRDILRRTTVVPEDGSSHTVQGAHRTTALIFLGEEVGKKRFLWSLNVRMSFPSNEPTLG